MNHGFSLKRGTSHMCLSQRSDRVRYYKQVTIRVKFQYKHLQVKNFAEETAVT